MPSECSDRKQPKLHHHLHGSGAHLPEQEHHPIPCPRCDSPNTKFCYYNNYNFSQPRHFCKSCRRYWTHGGTLRDIPVGGGTRKNAKRSRTTSSSSPSASAAVCGVAPSDHHPPLNSTPVFLPFSANHAAAVHSGGEVVKPSASVCGSFTSLLSTQGAPNFLALGGFGLGLGPGLGLDDVAFGIGRGVIWPSFQGVGGDGGIGGVGVGVGSNGGPVGIGNTWQLESGDGGLIGGDCFPWPDLAISTSGSGLK